MFDSLEGCGFTQSSIHQNMLMSEMYLYRQIYEELREVHLEETRPMSLQIRGKFVSLQYALHILRFIVHIEQFIVHVK